MGFFDDINPIKAIGSTGGKIGAFAGMGMGGPFGAAQGAVLGNAADGMGKDQAKPQPPPDLYGDALKAQLDKSRGTADKANSAADQFRSNMPGYTGDQINAAKDEGLSNIQAGVGKAKADANSRGLLYSGVNDANQANVKAQESSNVAKKVQGINTDAQSKQAQYDKTAADAESSFAQQQTGLANYQATRQQTAYQQALEEQQNQNAFYGSIAQGVGGLAGLIAMI